jgi:ATP-dependent Lon protease
MVAPLFVGRDKSIRALESAMTMDKNIFLATQKEAKVDNPGQKDIFRLGTLSTVLQLLRLPDGTVKTLIEGKRRGRVLSYLPHQDHFLVEIEVLEDIDQRDPETEALIRSVTQAFDRYAKLNKKVPEEIIGSVSQIENPSRLADTIIAHLNLKIDVKQSLLEIIDSNRRLEQLLEVLGSEIEISQLEQRIKKRVKQQMEKTQKEYYLNEQMRAIQHEMGDKDDFKSEIKELEEQLANKRMPRLAADKCAHEIKKLKFMSPMSAEATVVRNYIDWLLSLPWYERTRDKLDLNEAERILDEDHYGLEKPKERILEYLAVQALVRRIKGPILCLVGPPGVGKTSLAKSVARATGRNFVRLSLGGVRDEAEIRGHRRTYIGALPGKIIQSLRKAKSNNPVFCLDEVDKMSADFRGDPSAALLEVLDPEQNFAFNDHYLDVDYDLSEVMFITTANTLYSIPAPLQDRMEIIRLPGYTEFDKLNIAHQFLTKKQCRANGLNPERVQFTDNALKTVIRSYTREAGVRNLEREIAAICRKVAREVVKEGRRNDEITISKSSIARHLGVPKFRRGQLEEADSIGLTNGLAWTEVGGEVLMSEAVIMPGRGRVTITGKLGDVMQESAQAALSYVRSRAMSLGLSRHFYQKIDTHIHVPEGAIPKDGPSAGITIATSIVSALLQLPVRRDLAMTGEITLRGRVLPIGGLKEKLFAAHRLGVKKVLIPLENEKDLKDIPPKVLKAMDIVPVEHMDQVLRQAIAIDDPDSIFHDEKDDFQSRIMAVKKERPAPTGPEEVTAH